MKIGELARTAGVGVEKVRFYEPKRLIARPKRPQSGSREYNAHAAERIHFIRRAQELGFSLAEVKQLLELRLDPRRSCADVKAEAEAKIDEINQKMASLRRMRRALVEVTNA